MYILYYILYMYINDITMCTVCLISTKRKHYSSQFILLFPITDLRRTP